MRYEPLRVILISGLTALAAALAWTYIWLWRETRKDVPGMAPWGALSALTFIVVAIVDQFDRLHNDKVSWRFFVLAVACVFGFIALRVRAQGRGSHG